MSQPEPTGELERRKRKECYTVTGADRERFERDIYRELIRERTGGLRERAGRLRGEVDADQARKAAAAQAQAQAQKEALFFEQFKGLVSTVTDAVNEIKNAVESAKQSAGKSEAVIQGLVGEIGQNIQNLVGEIGQGIQALVGVDRRLAAVGPKRS